MKKQSNVSIQNDLPVVANYSWGYGYAMSSETPGHLQGRILTLIEAIGLPEKQENSLKSLITQTIWNTITDEAVYISDKRYTEIRNLYQKMREQQGNNPPSAI